MFRLFSSIRAALLQNPLAVDLANFDSIQSDGLFSGLYTIQNQRALYVPKNATAINDLTSNKVLYIKREDFPMLLKTSDKRSGSKLTYECLGKINKGLVLTLVTGNKLEINLDVWLVSLFCFANVDKYKHINHVNNLKLS